MTSWAYGSKTGQLLKDGVVFSTGYSGIDAGYNNPDKESVHDVGPIPRGEFNIGSFFNDPRFGPTVAHLYPRPGTNVFGRDGFLIHGDSSAHPGKASHGCIILPSFARVAIRDSNIRRITVF